MLRILIILAAVISLAACSATERGAGIGAGAGAIIGGATTGTVQGAAIGAAVGGVAGALLGRSAENDEICYYKDRRGRIYEDACPAG